MLRLLGAVDEVGYGSLAGPCIAVLAVFATDDEFRPPVFGIRDSKAFKDKSRLRPVFRSLLRCRSLVQFSIGLAAAWEFDHLGAGEAHRRAFDRALAGLRRDHMPEHIIVDGNFVLRGWSPQAQTSVPKADAKYWTVGAASILAKVIRDDHMHWLARRHPGYAWDRNVGYCSSEHLEGVRRLGMTIHHRKAYTTKALASADARAREEG